MKKVIAVVLMLCLAGVGARAALTIDLGIAGGLLVHNGTSWPADELPGGVLFQLIWSIYNAYSPSTTPIGGKPGVLPGYWIVFETFLPGSSNWPDDHDGTKTYQDSDVGGNNINAGYMYARVFESGTPVIGTWYASSKIYDTSTFNTNPMLPPSSLDITYDAPGGWFDPDIGAWFLPLNHGQVVPEPATWAMGLMGLGLLVYRRLRK